MTDAVAHQFFGHPTAVFTIPDSIAYQVPWRGKPKLMDAVDYRDPGVTLDWPPEWHALAGGPTGKEMG